MNFLASNQNNDVSLLDTLASQGVNYNKIYDDRMMSAWKDALGVEIESSYDQNSISIFKELMNIDETYEFKPCIEMKLDFKKYHLKRPYSLDLGAAIKLNKVTLQNDSSKHEQIVPYYARPVENCYEKFKSRILTPQFIYTPALELTAQRQHTKHVYLAGCKAVFGLIGKIATRRGFNTVMGMANIQFGNKLVGAHPDLGEGDLDTTAKERLHECIDMFKCLRTHIQPESDFIDIKIQRRHDYYQKKIKGKSKKPINLKPIAEHYQFKQLKDEKEKKKDKFIPGSSYQTALAMFDEIPDFKVNILRLLNLFALLAECESNKCIFHAITGYLLTFLSDDKLDKMMQLVKTLLYPEGYDTMEPEAKLFDKKEHKVPPWLELLKRGRKDWRTVVRCEGFSRLSNLISLLVTVGLCDASTFTIDVAGIRLFAPKMLSKHENAFSLLMP